MLGFMAMEYFRTNPVMMFPLIALAIFMAVFLVVTLRATLTQKSRWEAVANLPLERTDADHQNGRDHE